jgi:hypothetical protein
MTSFKKIMYVIYTLMLIITILGVLYNDSIIATFDLETSNTIWMFWALIGYVLLMFESVLENIHLSSKNKSYAQLAKENTELKARMYDDMMKTRDRDFDKDRTVIRNTDTRRPATDVDNTIIVDKTKENRPRPLL